MTDADTASSVGSDGPEDLPLDLTLACSHFARFAARRADVGVSSVGWRVASTLDRVGALRVSEIAAHERVSRPTATTVVQRLEDGGLVARRPDPHDSRSTFVELTDVGRERLAAWRAALVAGVGDLIGALDPAEQDTLRRAARILHTLTDSEGTDPTA